MPRIDDIDDFVALLAENPAIVHHFGGAAEAGDLYCPKCGADRRMRVHGLPSYRHGNTIQGMTLNLADRSTAGIADQIAPMTFLLECLQCGSNFTVLLFEGPDGYELAVFPGIRGGLTTPHTPEGVAFYLDQAARAQSAGAKSAAVAMYRAALEHLLYEQGFKAKMLGPKINELETAVVNGDAPKWASDLDAEFLKVIGKLGNVSIHPGGGDISQQEHLDSDLLRQVTVTFAELLRLVYERDKETDQRLAALKAVVSEFDQPLQPGTP